MSGDFRPIDHSDLDLDLLRRVADVPGLSGFEDAAQALVAEELAKHADEVWRDRMGNVIALRKARKKGSGPTRKVLYAAHADEIGAVVSHVDEEGFIRFRAVGGLDPRTLPSQRVVIHATKDGERQVKGVIAAQSGWLGEDEDRQRVFPVKELYIDVGLPGSVVRRQVHVGDAITFASTFDVLNDDVVVGRNFDDRIGTFCLLEAMRRLEDSDVDVYAVSTVQEEVGVRGIPTAAHAIQPDIALAIDGSLPSDTPYAKPFERQCELGKGTGIYLIDNRTIGNQGLLKGLFATCEAHGIPYQRNLGGATDASEIQRRNLGAWATTIGAPTRYMHSTVQLCHLSDVEATVQLLAKFPQHAAGILPPDWR